MIFEKGRFVFSGLPAWRAYPDKAIPPIYQSPKRYRNLQQK
jgi:hypothetical protein